MAHNEPDGLTDGPEIIDPEEYEHLLEDFSHLAPPSRDEVLEGRVIKVSGQNVFIDVGSKSDGVAPLSQFAGLDGTTTVAEGDIVQVMVEQGRTAEGGYVLLSHERAARLKVWDHLQQALEQQTTLNGRDRKSVV